MTRTNESPVSLAASGALCLVDHPQEEASLHEIVADDEVYCLLGDHYVERDRTLDNPSGDRACFECLHRHDPTLGINHPDL